MANDNTPMMRQYKEIKEQNQDSILFFRMGDFYEMFYEDAEEVSRLLNLTLTQRQGVPMAGLPYHAVQNYLARLLQFGRRVAICEQTELPNKGSGLTKREVVEIVSPGTVLQENFLDGSSNNYLQAFCKLGKVLGMALLDFSTGEFRAAGFIAPNQELLGEILQRELLLASSRELLLMEELHDEFSSEFWDHGAGEASRLCNRIPAWCFAPDSAERKLSEFFKVQNLKGFGFRDEDQLNMANGAAWGAAWVIVEYLQQSHQQAGVLSHVQRLLPLRRKEQLQLDSAALRNLEIFHNMQNGNRSYTLFQILHQCQSAMGSRCLHRWLREPLLQRERLQQRYQRVQALLENGLLRSSLRELLGQLSDLERIMSRISTAKANARDLVALRNSLALFAKIEEKIEGSGQAEFLNSIFLHLDSEDTEDSGGTEVAEEPTDSANLASELLREIERQAPDTDRRGHGGKGHRQLENLHELLRHSITEQPSAVLHEGGMIAAGYSAELDELHQMQDDRRQILDDYVEREQARVGNVNLKLKYNKVIGYYFELSKAQATQAKLPKHFVPRQSLVNGERYSTRELTDLELKLNSAAEQVVQLERRLFEELRQQIVPHTGLILRLAQALAELDVLANFSEVAVRHNYICPELQEAGQSLVIEGGRHPVVEHYLRDEDFVPNDLELDSECFFALITGPNMAGKSTYLRQNALIVLMAQVGCYVPAKRARIPIIDRIFCRVGASDNLTRGESTFMVEMQETARILNEATRQSLIIMDEVGRGTSTRDGVAIAQSICEYLLRTIQCMTLFATHYHELTNLSEQHLKLLCLAVDDSGEDILFLKHVEEGAIASSYGVHVAALAGIPPTVTERAVEILQSLQSEMQGQADTGRLALVRQGTKQTQAIKKNQAEELYQMQANPAGDLQVAESASEPNKARQSKATGGIAKETKEEALQGQAPQAESHKAEAHAKSADGTLFELLLDSVIDLQEEFPVVDSTSPIKWMADVLANDPVEDRPQARTSKKAKKSSQLFSDPDLLFGELQQLAAKDHSLQDLKPARALKILRGWAKRFL